jgi:hypothetical protein
MKVVACPECSRKVRPCNLERHRRTHLLVAQETEYGTRWLPAKRPITVGGSHDRRYDDFVPRGEGDNRFRIYRLRAGELDLLASAPDPPSVGVAIYHLDQEGEFITDDATGVLDTIEEPGHWLIHPFALGRRPREEAA